MRPNFLKFVPKIAKNPQKICAFLLPKNAPFMEKGFRKVIKSVHLYDKTVRFHLNVALFRMKSFVCSFEVPCYEYTGCVF